MAQRKSTTLEQEYKKEVNRIRQFIRRIKKRGYTPADDILPKRPQKITKKAVQELKKIKAPEIYKRSTYLNKSTGETVTGLEGRAIEKRQRKNASPKQPTVSKEVKKQISRINRFLKPIQKRGYSLKISLPQDEESLKQITSKNIYDYLQYTVKSTGQVLSGVEGRKLERSVAAKKSARTRRINKRITTNRELANENIPMASTVIFDNVIEELERWTPSPNWSDYWSNKIRGNKNILQRLIKGEIDNISLDVDNETIAKQALAQRLQKHATEILEIVERILYESDRDYVYNGVQQDFGRFAMIIKGTPLSVDEAIELEDSMLANEVEEIE